MSDELKALEKAYPPFKDRLTSQEFATKVSSLGNKMQWNFVRASLLYQQALKCKNCELNVAMLLLCSCADAMKVAGENAGSHNNFKKFYMDYCPSNLKVPPIKYYPNGKPPTQIAPFDKALDFIYSKFRCLYVHEGKGRLRPLPPGVEWFAAPLLDIYKDEYYNVDTLKILEWFSKITVESRYNIVQRAVN